MKKNISLILLLSIVAGLIPQLSFAAFAENLPEWEFSEFSYGDESGVELTKYNGDLTDVFVPQRLDTGEKVLKLGSGLFRNNKNLNSVSLGNGIRVIGEEAFYGAENLVCIMTNPELSVIEDRAFYGCN